MAAIRLEEQAGYKDWLKNTNGSWQHDASMQAASDENPFIYLTNTGGDDAVFQIALSKLVDIQLIRKNSILVTPSVLDKAKGIKVELRDQSQNILATSKTSLNSKTWMHLLVNAENIALDITELWVTFVLPAGASTVIGGIQGQILTQDQTVVDSIKVEATDQDTAIDLTQAKLNASKYFVKFAPESWWRADGVLKAKQLLTVDPLDITTNVAEAMNKTFYVDAVNGDDNNDGSSLAPFKTIKKAIDSIPTGGYGYIRLNGDYTLDQRIDIENRTIKLELNGTLSTQWYEVANDYAGMRSIVLYNSSLFIVLDSIIGGKIHIPVNNTGISHLAPSYSDLFRPHQHAIYAFIFMELMIREDNYNPIVVEDGNLCGVHRWVAYRPSFYGVSISGVYSGINRNIKIDTDSYLLHAGEMPMGFFYNYQGGLTDLDGTDIDPATKIAGVVKDINGVPRNIVSNIVL